MSALLQYLPHSYSTAGGVESINFKLHCLRLINFKKPRAKDRAKNAVFYLDPDQYPPENSVVFDVGIWCRTAGLAKAGPWWWSQASQRPLENISFRKHNELAKMCKSNIYRHLKCRLTAWWPVLPMAGSDGGCMHPDRVRAGPQEPGFSQSWIWTERRLLWRCTGRCCCSRYSGL